MYIIFLCTNAKQIRAIFAVSAWILITIFVSSPFEFSRRAEKKGLFFPQQMMMHSYSNVGHN